MNYTEHETVYLTLLMIYVNIFYSSIVFIETSL